MAMAAGPGGRQRPAAALFFLQAHAPVLSLSPEAHVIKRCPVQVMEKGQRKPHGPGRGSGLRWSLAGGWALPRRTQLPASPPWPAATLINGLDAGDFPLFGTAPGSL